MNLKRNLSTDVSTNRWILLFDLSANTVRDFVQNFGCSCSGSLSIVRSTSRYIVTPFYAEAPYAIGYPKSKCLDKIANILYI